MEAITILIYLNLLIYTVFIARLLYGFPKVKSFQSTPTTPKTTFSILIPFRNEAEHLPELLASISKLNYPKELFELIFIDDASEDHSAQLLTQWRMENGLFQTTVLDNLRLSGSPKKDAITRAIPVIQNQWIVTTDADCIVNGNWLLTLDNYIQKNEVSMIVGAVTYTENASFLHRFQQLDLMSLQGATLGSFGLQKGFMCNGANFAYTKQLFLDLNGFKGNETIASGDDVFLLQKAVSSHPNQVHYLKSDCNIVQTKPLNSWKLVFHQRVRWASKTTAYKNNYAEALAMSVFFGNLSLLVALGCALFKVLPWSHCIVLFLIKFSVDLILLQKTQAFLKIQKFKLPLLSSVLYPFFSTSVALYSLFGTYQWKGRVFKK